MNILIIITCIIFAVILFLGIFVAYIISIYNEMEQKEEEEGRVLNEENIGLWKK